MADRKTRLTLTLTVTAGSRLSASQIQERISNAIESGLWTCAERGIKVGDYAIEAELEPL